MPVTNLHDIFKVVWFSFNDLKWQNTSLLCKKMNKEGKIIVLSPVSPNSGSRIWHKFLKNPTNGTPDSCGITSYLASHWSDFSGYCIISWNLNLVKPDSDLDIGSQVTFFQNNFWVWLCNLWNFYVYRSSGVWLSASYRTPPRTLLLSFCCVTREIEYPPSEKFAWSTKNVFLDSVCGDLMCFSEVQCLVSLFSFSQNLRESWRRNRRHRRFSGPHPARSGPVGPHRRRRPTVQPPLPLGRR